MGGESGLSSIENMLEMPTGTESELLRIGGAQLFLIDGEESVRVGAGDFSLIMMVQANTPLATLVAQVAEFQWPLGKDSPVLKIANLRYTFSIPGLLYGLILPDNTHEENVQKFETYVRQYCTFEIRPEIAKAAGVNDLRLWSSVGRSVDTAVEGARYWTAVAEDVEGYSSKLVRQMSNGSTVAANSIIKSGQWASWGIQQGGSFVKSKTNPRKSDGEELSPRMRKRVDQARRMSAVAKLLSRTVLKGAVSATGHVANFLGTAIGGTPPVKAFMSSDSRREVAVASVDAFAKVVEAVETAGRSLALTTSAVGTELVQHRFGEQAGYAAQDGMGAMGNMINSMWTLNKVGLRMLWHTTAASTALNASRSRSASNSSSPSPMSEESLQSTAQMSTSPGLSSPTSGGTSLSRQSSDSFIPTISLSPPSNDEVTMKTAQLFPSSSAAAAPTTTPLPSESHVYAIPTNTTLYMHPGYQAAYYHPARAPHHPNSPFHQYRRRGSPPQMQTFFPYTINDTSKSQ